MVLHMRVKKRIGSVNQTALERNGPLKWTWKGTGDGWVRCQQHCLGKLGQIICAFAAFLSGPDALLGLLGRGRASLWKIIGA